MLDSGAYWLVSRSFDSQGDLQLLLWLAFGMGDAGLCQRRAGKTRTVAALFLISCGCLPKALQELWLTVPFVDKPVLEPPSPNLRRCLELSGNIVTLFPARTQMSGQIGGTVFLECGACSWQDHQDATKQVSF